MPEGHTVHRLAAALGELFGGRVVSVSSPQGRAAGVAAALDGRRLERTEAHGKHLLASFVPAGGSAEELRWLRVHLGLYGSWTFDGDASFVAPHSIGAPRRRIGEREEGSDAPPAVGEWQVPEPRGQVRLRLRTEHGVADLTGPTACEVLDALEKAAVHARLGPDPLRPDGSAEPFVERLARTRRAVGELLMDQSVIAGIGNIYRAELLYRAGLHPRLPGNEVGEVAARALWADAVALLGDGVRTGAIVTVSEADRGYGVESRTWAPAAERATPEESDERWYVYHRTGRPCLRCGTPIQADVMAARTVYWCPVCQA